MTGDKDLTPTCILEICLRDGIGVNNESSLTLFPIENDKDKSLLPVRKKDSFYPLSPCIMGRGSG